MNVAQLLKELAECPLNAEVNVIMDGVIGKDISLNVEDMGGGKYVVYVETTKGDQE